MIERRSLLALSYYSGAAFTGSCERLRYRIEKKQLDERDIFFVSAWYGPFSSENTPEDEKDHFECDFSEEGLEAVADWLNKRAKA